MTNFFKAFCALCFFACFTACEKESVTITDNADNGNLPVQIVSSSKISATPQYCGMYVSDFETICGNPVSENLLLTWCQMHHINALSLYGLGTILSSTSNYPILANFIKKAKLQYGIKQVAAVRGSATNVIGQTASYNTSRADTTERFNYMHLELEWWNNACTYANYLSQLTTIKQWGDAQPKKVYTEEYMGWFKNPTGQDSLMASGLIKNSHRIFVHDYVTTPNFSYMKNRLDYIGRAAKALNKTAEVIIIFSAQPTYSYNYFLTHTFDNAYQAIVNGYNAASFTGKNYINITGYQIFDSNSARIVQP